MATRSSKHANLIPTHIIPTGGLNVALPGIAIADNELQTARNFIYSPTTGRLRVRPPVSCVTATPLASAITNLHYYVKNATTAFLVCSCANNKNYYLNGSNAWVELGAIAANSIPSFLTFNNLVLWADGAGLYSWDGITTSITITTITTALKPDAIYEMASRVVINDTADYDAVYFSGPEDETDWDTSGGDAIGLRAGYGDGLNVNAFSGFGTDLIVSKGGKGKCFYRVSTVGTSSDWTTEKLVNDTSANHNRMIAGLPNDIIYVDTNTVKSLAGVQEYGDIQVMNKGEKVNKEIHAAYNSSASAYFVRNLPSLDMVFIGFGGTIYVYYPAFGTFTTIIYGSETITSVIDADGTVYLGNSGGDLYKWDESATQDELIPSTDSDYTAVMKTKEFRFAGGEGIVRRIETSLETINSGVATLELVKTDGATKLLKTFTLDDSKTYLYDRTGDLYAWTEDLAEEGTGPLISTSRGSVRVYSFSLQFTVSSGACYIDSFDVLSAMVNG